MLPLIAFILIHNSLPHKICKGNNGYMMLSEETRILTEFDDESGLKTLLVDAESEAWQNQEFNFSCYNIQNGSNAKVIFGSDSTVGQESPATRILKNSHLDFNTRFTNTVPISIKCESVCQVIFIGGFHLHLLVFPFVYQLYTRETALLQSSFWNPAELFIFVAF